MSGKSSRTTGKRGQHKALRAANAMLHF